MKKVLPFTKSRYQSMEVRDGDYSEDGVHLTYDASEDLFKRVVVTGQEHFTRLGDIQALRDQSDEEWEAGTFSKVDLSNNW